MQKKKLKKNKGRKNFIVRKADSHNNIRETKLKKIIFQSYLKLIRLGKLKKNKL